MPQRIRAGCDAPSLDISKPILTFATAHSCGLRRGNVFPAVYIITLPQRIRAGCDVQVEYIRLCGHALPQRIRAGCDHVGWVCGKLGRLCHSAFVRVATNTEVVSRLTAVLCHSAFVRVATAEKQCSALRICCEKVDSFSSVGESGLALTIFPFSFAAKATYVAINDSFGRAIDRFFGANRTGISVSYDFAEHPCL